MWQIFEIHHYLAVSVMSLTRGDPLSPKHAPPLNSIPAQEKWLVNPLRT